MGWWWKLTVEWPAAVGDWLWKFLVTMPAASLKEMTVRRIFMFLALIAMIFILHYAVPLDLAFAVAGDVLSYFEAIAIVGLFAARLRSREMRDGIIQLTKDAARRLARTIGGSAFRRHTARRRAPNQTRRLRRFGRSRNSEDGPGLARARRSGSYSVRPGCSSSGVCAFSPRRSNSAQASSAVSTKLNSARSAASTIPFSTSASKFTMRRQ